MSEIKKLYKNAGIENYSIKGWTGFVPNKYKIIADDDDNVIDIVLDFTAEKQLELIKWLCKDDVVRIEKYTLSGETFYELAGTFNDWYDDYKYSYATEKFEEALAGFINSLWQDLTEEERKQIADILRG